MNLNEIVQLPLRTYTLDVEGQKITLLRRTELGCFRFA